METAALSNSTSWLIANYVRTRFPAWLVLPLALIVTVPAVVSGAVSSASEFAVVWGMALLLVLEFRLWDDMYDREQDCREDPSRVLCQAESLKPFVVLYGLLRIGNLALVVWRWVVPAIATLVVLQLLLGRWYAIRSRWRLGSVVNYHLVLLKYPACGYVLAAGFGASAGASLFASLAVVYLGLCIGEVLHDRRLRKLNAAWICLGIEATLLAGTVAWWSAQGLNMGAAEVP